MVGCPPAVSPHCSQVGLQSALHLSSGHELPAEGWCHVQQAFSCSAGCRATGLRPR